MVVQITAYMLGPMQKTAFPPHPEGRGLSMKWQCQANHQGHLTILMESTVFTEPVSDNPATKKLPEKSRLSCSYYISQYQISN